MKNAFKPKIVSDKICHMTDFVISQCGVSRSEIVTNVSHCENVTNCNKCVHPSLDMSEYDCSTKLTQSSNFSTGHGEVNMTTKIEVSKEMFDELIARVAKLEEQITKSRGTASTREMTDDDARRVLNGDLKEVAHKAAAEKLGLSYGQVYSCRGEYTFKHILKTLKAEGFKNPWVK